jgi:hypothetical protein
MTAAYSSKEWNFQLAYPSTWKLLGENRRAGGWHAVVAIGDRSGKNGPVGMMVNARDGAVLAKTKPVGGLAFEVVSVGSQGEERKLAQSPAEFLRRTQNDDAAAFPGYSGSQVASWSLGIVKQFDGFTSTTES